MGGLVEGAASGAAFDLLFISLVDATQRVARFASDFNRLMSTLCLIKLAIDDIHDFNKILDRPQQETLIFPDRLLKGEELIRKCSKVKKWNLFKRLYYSIKLSKLETSLVNFFHINVAALHFRESKRNISVAVEQQMKEITSMRFVVSNLEEEINELRSMTKKGEIRRWKSNNFSKIVV